MTRYKLPGLVMAVLMTIATLYAVSATSTAPTPPAATADLAGPINAAFYYPWYPETEHWSTHYKPTLGAYDSSDPAVLARHVSMAKYAGLDAFIPSWWGAGTRTATRLPTLLDAAAAQNFA